MTEMTTLAPKRDAEYLLEYADSNKNTRNRVALYAARATDLLKPDLAMWRDELKADGRAPATQSAYLSSVRAAYRRMLDDDDFRDVLYQHARQSGATTPADQKAFVDELTTRIENAIKPATAKVKMDEHQDRPDAMHLRLTKAQAERLMSAPGVDTLKHLRDTALISLLLCTGIREAELCELDVKDLRQELGGELALYVREGKGGKKRLVPYGELDWVLLIVDRWLNEAGIEEGPVFRGLHKGGKRLREGCLSVRSVEIILASYPITIRGKLMHVRPHDCRRTYARRLHDAYVKLAAIQQNLGHKRIETTLGYIGELDAGQRRAKAIYHFDLSKLEAP